MRHPVHKILHFYAIFTIPHLGALRFYDCKYRLSKEIKIKKTSENEVFTGQTIARSPVANSV